jgi:transposase
LHHFQKQTFLEEGKMGQQYVVKLSEAERYQLKQIVSSGTAPARTVRRAHILLKSDRSEGGPNWSYQEIMEAFAVSNVTISDVRRTYVQDGFESALHRKKPQREYERRLDGAAEAHLVTLACSAAPEGHQRWTLRLLTERLIELEVVETCSHETVRTTLKKMNLSLG